jgi:hypothetical protein
MAATVPDFVDVIGRDVEVGEVEHYVVANIFRILHGSEDGVSATAKHDVEGAEVGVALVAPRHQNNEDGRD